MACRFAPPMGAPPPPRAPPAPAFGAATTASPFGAPATPAFGAAAPANPFGAAAAAAPAQMDRPPVNACSFAHGLPPGFEDAVGGGMPLQSSGSRRRLPQEASAAGERPGEQPLDKGEAGEESAVTALATATSGAVDFAKIPVLLDKRLEAMDADAAMRPTKIIVGERWSKKSTKGLLGKLNEMTLHKGQQDTEKQRAFDLLDAISRSGSLPIDTASLHVLLAVTHCFDDSLLDTLVVKNKNPIEKLEASSLLVAEVIKGLPAPQLVRGEVYDAVSTHSCPALLPSSAKRL